MFIEKLVSIKNHLSTWCLPPTCLLCGLKTSTEHNICEPCKQDLPQLHAGCRRCARLLPEEAYSPTSEQELLCGACIKDPPPYDYTYALFPYQTPITELIMRLKFHHQLTHAKLLGELLADKIATIWYKQQPLPTRIIPMPLHRLRLRERGFNQAVEIGKPIARRLNLILDRFNALRVKYTIPQSLLPARARVQNVRNAFVVKKNYRGMHIALLDDVVTTGKTVAELCNVLQRHGAKRIDIWCCARAIER